MLNNIAIFERIRDFKLRRLQAKKAMESNTDPIDSIQLNFKPICVFEYGNQIDRNSTCCGKSIKIL